MEEIIRLLQEKNHYLEKFSDLNEKEMDAFSQGNFITLDSFYHQREEILGMVRHLDNLLEKVKLDDSTPVKPADRKQVQELMAEKDILVTQILSQDLQILSYIDREKSALIQELRGVKKSRKAVGAYKSPNVIK